MDERIEIRITSKRGCGFRKPGGLYLVGPMKMSPCGKLPIELNVCPTCKAGIKPTRGFTWVDANKFFSSALGYTGPCDICENDTILGTNCMLKDPPEKAGLIWIGEKYYPTPQDFLKEAQQMGASRRIPAVPKDFVIGETMVLLAHRKCPLGPPQAIEADDSLVGPAIFSSFIPKAIERVCDGTETEEEIDRMIKRGLTPVKDEQAQQDLPGCSTSCETTAEGN